MNKILVCPVAYNEKNKIRDVIERYLKSGIRPRTDFLIVDDASEDGTTEVIQEYAAQGVQLVKHDQRRGAGAAIRTAIQYARRRGYEVLVIMAGNNKDDPDEIPALIEPILKSQCDFVQGSRYKRLPGAGGPPAIRGHMPYYRMVATRLHPWLMSRITGRRVTDSTNGFRALRLSIFDDEKIDIDQSWLDQYELEPYLFYKVLTLGYPFIEVPVTKVYPPRKLGFTKMRPWTGWWSILRPLVFLGLGLKK
jgi:dolichol-phosphate mannosyltransferase